MPVLRRCERAAASVAQPRRSRRRMASSFPKSLDTLSDRRRSPGASRTDGRSFEIRIFAGGEIVPPLQVLDAVQNGTVECGQTAGYYYIGKNPALAFDTALPFGHERAAAERVDVPRRRRCSSCASFSRSTTSCRFPGGNTGTQMAGWYRKEIKTVADLKGLKMRVGGLARADAREARRRAAADRRRRDLPGARRGTIDAAEWVGPYDDEKLGFHKVAKFDYYPGWWEGVRAAFGLREHEAMGRAAQALSGSARSCACAESNVHMLARYDAKNTEALRRLVGAGAQLRAFPRPVMEAC